jgi:hypothetical protein
MVSNVTALPRARDGQSALDLQPDLFVSQTSAGLHTNPDVERRVPEYTGELEEVRRISGNCRATWCVRRPPVVSSDGIWV